VSANENNNLFYETWISFDRMQSATTPPISQLLTFRPKLQTFQPKTPTLFSIPTMASVSGFKTRIKSSSSSSSSAIAAVSDDRFVTLIEYLGKGGGIGVNDDLVVLIDHIQYACKRIAALVASPFNSSIGKQTDVPTSGSDRDAPKPLDILTVCFSSHLLNFRLCWLVFCYTFPLFFDKQFN
jgi:fructose-1,6-bisphosphatase I